MRRFDLEQFTYDPTLSELRKPARGMFGENEFCDLDFVIKGQERDVHFKYHSTLLNHHLYLSEDPEINIRALLTF
jgi:hypothetical protein